MLAFNKTVIKIVQFTDLHLGESDAHDSQTMANLRSVLASERPDFVVYTGDLVSGYAVSSESQRLFLWHQALSACSENEVPFATVFGNHDDQPYRCDPLFWNSIMRVLLCTTLLVAYFFKNLRMLALIALVPILTALMFTAPSDSVRVALIEHERMSFPEWSYTFGRNYRLVLKTPNTSTALYFLDSGGGGIPEGVHPHARMDPPGIVFLHIPPAQFAGVYTNADCVDGPPLESASTCPGVVLPAIAVFVGHDHGNEYCCNRSSVLYCYGRQSGFGGYSFGNKPRGARVIELHGERIETRLV
jgi:hypothetical protein